MCAYVKNQIEGVSMFSNSKCESFVGGGRRSDKSIDRKREGEREREEEWWIKGKEVEMRKNNFQSARVGN